MRRAAALRPDTVVLTSPHALLYRDYFHIAPGSEARGDLRQFGAGTVRVHARYDEKFVRELEKSAEKAGIPAGTLGERDPALDHATVIPLRFLNEVWSDYRLVRIGLSGLSALEHYRLGQCIAQVADRLDRRVVFLASGDLSHKLTPEGPYGFAPEGPEFDRQVTAALGKGDFLSLLRFPADFTDAAAECGLRSFQIMAGALDGRAVQSELLSYEGPFGVGYGVAAFTVTGDDGTRCFAQAYQDAVRRELAELRAGEDDYVRLARLSLETWVTAHRNTALPEKLPEELLHTRAGVFVSLKKDGLLRGCIGTIGPTMDNVAQEIVQNAVSAGTRDPRFPPVTEQELPQLVYSVDVLGETEPIASAEQLDVKRYGVIVTSGSRRGLLLPNLSGVDTVARQIAIAREKAGIPAREPVSLERFEVVRHH
jgi:AmmeMemoRadiSam system protein A/AmmeMemoRadiSam system protein B